jgi:hypothetical protein
MNQSVHRATTLLAPVVVLLGLLAGAAAPAGASDRGSGREATPVVSRDFPDPTVVRFEDRLVAVGTGPLAPTMTAPGAAGPWRPAGPALASIPRWARGRSIWASDLVRGPDGWLLYFSALVRGLGPDGRCIGVATAPTPLGGFRPTKRPLVCPAAAKGPTGTDRVVPPGLVTPAGVIDPDGYTTPGGRRYLTYRTQGLPATIRIVRLDPSGLRARKHATGAPLVASTGVIENPVLLKRGRTWVLLTSEGYYGGCGYSTTYRRATSLGGLALAPRQVLLDRSTSGLCGPGGAELSGDTLFFHAWTCPTAKPLCKANRDYHRHSHRFEAARSLFAADLRWNSAGEPRISSYVVPARGSDVAPVVNATDVVTVAPVDPTHPEPLAPGETVTTDPLGGLLGGLLGIVLPGLF